MPCLFMMFCHSFGDILFHLFLEELRHKNKLMFLKIEHILLKKGFHSRFLEGQQCF